MKYIIALDERKRDLLRRLTWGDSRRSIDARILLWSDSKPVPGDSVLSCRQIAASLGVGLGRIARVRKRYAEGGVDAVIQPARRRRAARRWKADDEFEMKLLALFRSPPPRGCARWSLRLLAERMVEMNLIASVSHETVRGVLRRYADSGAA